MAYVGIAAVAAMNNAIKAMGTIVTVEPEEFLNLLEMVEEPLIVTGMGGVVNKHYQYLTSYKGLAFFTKSVEKLPLPVKAELITAKKIMIPDM